MDDLYPMPHKVRDPWMTALATFPEDRHDRRYLFIRAKGEGRGRMSALGLLRQAAKLPWQTVFDHAHFEVYGTTVRFGDGVARWAHICTLPYDEVCLTGATVAMQRMILRFEDQGETLKDIGHWVAHYTRSMADFDPTRTVADRYLADMQAAAARGVA